MRNNQRGPRASVLTEGQWDRIQPSLPASLGQRGRLFRGDRRYQGAIYSYRCGISWRDVPARSVSGRRFGNATAATTGTAPGIQSWPSCSPWPILQTRSIRRLGVSVDSTVDRPHEHGPTFRGTQGDPSNYVNFFDEPPEPCDLPLRGGLTAKVHALVDGNGSPSVLLDAQGPCGNAPMLTHLMGHLKIHPDRVRRDEVHSFKSDPDPAAKSGHHGSHPAAIGSDRGPEKPRLRRMQTTKLR